MKCYHVFSQVALLSCCRVFSLSVLHPSHFVCLPLLTYWPLAFLFSPSSLLFSSHPPLSSFFTRLLPTFSPRVSLSAASRRASSPSPPREPLNGQTVTQLAYHNIMRLGAPKKLKEAIFLQLSTSYQEGTGSFSSSVSGGERDEGDGGELAF